MADSFYNQSLRKENNVKKLYNYQILCCGAHKICLVKVILMGIHNIGFGTELKEFKCHHSCFSRALINNVNPLPDDKILGWSKLE